jgi:ABC-type sugar transport system ATPase subunit
VTLGIRAEDIHFPVARSESAVDNPLDARAVLVEPLGDTLLIHFEIGTPEPGGVETAIVVKADARARIATGDQARVFFDMRRAHLFDNQSGRNIHDPAELN